MMAFVLRVIFFSAIFFFLRNVRGWQFEEIRQRLLAGHRLTAVFYLGSCDANADLEFVPDIETLVLSLAVSPWQYFNMESKEFLAFSNTYPDQSSPNTPDTIFLVYTAVSILPTGNVEVTVSVVDAATWDLTREISFGCFLGENVQFWDSDEDSQFEVLPTYDSIRKALLAGNLVHRNALYDKCENPPPFNTTGGGTIVDFAIKMEGEVEYLEIIEESIVANPNGGAILATNSNHLKLYSSGVAVVRPAIWDMLEFDNEYFNPDGYICDFNAIEFLEEVTSRNRIPVMSTEDFAFLLKYSPRRNLQLNFDLSKCDDDQGNPGPLEVLRFSFEDLWINQFHGDVLGNTTMTCETAFTESGQWKVEQVSLDPNTWGKASVTVSHWEPSPYGLNWKGSNVYATCPFEASADELPLELWQNPAQATDAALMGSIGYIVPGFLSANSALGGRWPLAQIRRDVTEELPHIFLTSYHAANYLPVPFEPNFMVVTLSADAEGDTWSFSIRPYDFRWNVMGGMFLDYDVDAVTGFSQTRTSAQLTCHPK